MLKKQGKPTSVRKEIRNMYNSKIKVVPADGSCSLSFFSGPPSHTYSYRLRGLASVRDGLRFRPVWTLDILITNCQFFKFFARIFTEVDFKIFYLINSDLKKFSWSVRKIVTLTIDCYLCEHSFINTI